MGEILPVEAELPFPVFFVLENLGVPGGVVESGEVFFEELGELEEPLFLGLGGLKMLESMFFLFGGFFIFLKFFFPEICNQVIYLFRALDQVKVESNCVEVVFARHENQPLHEGLRYWWRTLLCLRKFFPF